MSTIPSHGSFMAARVYRQVIYPRPGRRVCCSMPEKTWSRSWPFQSSFCCRSLVAKFLNVAIICPDWWCCHAYLFHIEIYDMLICIYIYENISVTSRCLNHSDREGLFHHCFWLRRYGISMKPGDQGQPGPSTKAAWLGRGWKQLTTAVAKWRSELLVKAYLYNYV